MFGFSFSIPDSTQTYGSNPSGTITPLNLSLCSAIHRGESLFLIKSLINSQSIQSVDDEGNTPLALAIRRGDPTLIQELLQAGAKINTTPELKECVEQQNPQLLKLLLDRLDPTQQANLINTRFSTDLLVDSTLLYYACCADTSHWGGNKRTLSSEIIRLLLEKGAEAIVKCNRNKETPLHAVLFREGAKDIIPILLTYAPKLIETQDGEGATPLYKACKEEDVNESKREHIIDLLINAASQANQANIHRGPNGQTTLHAVVQHWPNYNYMINDDNHNTLNRIVSKILLFYPSLINTRDKEGRTPLYYASERCHANFIRLLLEAKAEIKCGGPNDEAVLFTILKAKEKEESPFAIGFGRYESYLSNKDESLDYYLLNAASLFHKHQPQLIRLKDKGGFSPLYYACQKQNPKLIKFLLDAQVSTDERYGPDNDTALHSVLRSTKHRTENWSARECLLSLIEQNPSLINVKNKQGKTALYYACQKSNDKAVSLLIEKGATFNEKYGPLEESLLHAVLKMPHIFLSDNQEKAISAILDILHKKDKNLIHVRDKEGYTPLYYACEFGIHSAAAFLLEAKAEIVCGPDGQTVLHALAKAKVKYFKTICLKPTINQPEVSGPKLVGPFQSSVGITTQKQKRVTLLSYLLNKHPDLINQADKNGYTPLYFACQYGTKEYFDLLIQAGAKIEETYGANKETLFHALMHRSSSEDQTAILSYLLKSQSHLINHKDGRGFTALYYACQQGNKGAVQLFIDAQAATDICCGDKDETLFHTTARGHLLEHVSILSLLIEKQPSLLNHKNKEGLTPLDYAYQQGYKDVIQILLNYGALSTTQATKQAHFSKTENILSNKLDFSSLSQLDLSNLGITDSNLSEMKDTIQKCSQLQTLHLNHNPLGDKGVQTLSSILEGKPIVQLQLINIGMTDSGLQMLCKTISKLDTIQRLALSNNPFTDAGLEHLKQALVGKKLETISIDNTKCTGAGIAKFFA